GIPGAAGWLFEVVFAGVSLAIVWGAMAERAKLWVYFAFGAIFTVVYSLVSHWIWAPGGWLQRFGMQDFAGSTVVHYQGALAALAGAILLGPRIGKSGHDARGRDGRTRRLLRLRRADDEPRRGGRRRRRDLHRVARAAQAGRLDD